MPIEEIFTCLKREINPSICCVAKPAENGVEVILTEKVRRTDPNPPALNKLTLFGFDEVISINQDLVRAYYPILLPTKKAINKTCDGILLAAIKGKLYFLVTEMKSSLSNMNEHILKMQAGKNMVSYLKCILSEYLGIDTSSWNTYYCIFHIADPKRETNESLLISCDPKYPMYFCVENNDRFSALKLINESLI
ncbi:hypothetical protein J7S89_02035 [Acinetobacter baumannii]|uniref:hypothetical protein n=1 Tax=Acinetobacter baumannii TaxID=470 RepID=UPI000CE94477|nr:hypothetical protein [Acinetobacter baumannii]AVF06633.1 hypothetical protein AM457_03085 [Acinetobacter baumannii]EKV6440079.1 hypothetical protein [Acinetobacter baumannii]EKX1682530.1 hypothetical protein [Acinetobacter baumannii]EKX1733029.1 hypothetical protein [Acinetobacter baumannii]EKX1734822.1 hypothetical protein [Acinetobacter baumannii]